MAFAVMGLVCSTAALSARKFGISTLIRATSSLVNPVKEDSMNAAHFTDARIAEIDAGTPLTHEERTFLLEDTPRMEECSYTAEELREMNDKDLMNAAYSAWADYSR
jgi:hypothetical protein